MAKSPKLSPRLTDLRFRERQGSKASEVLDLRDWQTEEPLPLSASLLDLRSEQQADDTPKPQPAQEGSLRSRIRESIGQPVAGFREQLPQKPAPRKKPAPGKAANKEGSGRQFYESLPATLPHSPVAPVIQAAEGIPAYTRRLRAKAPAKREVKRMRNALLLIVAIALLASFLTRASNNPASNQPDAVRQEAASSQPEPAPAETPAPTKSTPASNSNQPAAPAQTAQPTGGGGNTPPASPEGSTGGGQGGGTTVPDPCVPVAGINICVGGPELLKVN